MNMDAIAVGMIGAVALLTLTMLEAKVHFTRAQFAVANRRQASAHHRIRHSPSGHQKKQFLSTL